MGRPQRVADLVKKGKSPGEISFTLNISDESVRQYILTALGQGLINRKNILFSIDKKIRDKIDFYIKKLKTDYWFNIWRAAETDDIKLEQVDIKLYLQFGNKQVILGDMYEHIREIETTMHKSIKKILIEKFGEDERGWWRKGIPKEVRKDLVKVYEDDDEPAKEAYCYTDFLDLYKIIKNNWELFENLLPKKIKSDRGILKKDLIRLNKIRNYVMHPVKNINPTEDDFTFIESFENMIQLDKWR